MLSDLIFRPFSLVEYDKIIELWQDCGIAARTGEDKDSINRIDQMNPGLFILAYTNNNLLIGTVYATFDGRRGWINHLCVANEYRKYGLASLLLNKVENELIQKGCPQINLLIYPDNSYNLEEWYGKRGYRTRELLFMYKQTNANN